MAHRRFFGTSSSCARRRGAQTFQMLHAAYARMMLEWLHAEPTGACLLARHLILKSDVYLLHGKASSPGNCNCKLGGMPWAGGPN